MRQKYPRLRNERTGPIYVTGQPRLSRPPGRVRGNAAPNGVTWMVVIIKVEVGVILQYNGDATDNGLEILSVSYLPPSSNFGAS